MEIEASFAWDLLDFAADKGYATVAVELMKAAIAADPEGAARRASGQPQYDHERTPGGAAELRARTLVLGESETLIEALDRDAASFALAAPAALRDCE